jgi:glucose/arabinose dehydrogenase
MMKKLLRIIFAGVLSVFLLFALFTYFPTSSEVKALPGSFEKSKIAEGFNTPTDFAFSPDGRIYVLEKGGAIKLLKNGQTLNYATLPVNSDGERGLLGIALDPNFASNKYIYIYYVRNDPLEIRVSRFIENGDSLNLASETVLLKSSQPLNLNHHSGTVRFGPDGKLWITIGNNSISSNSQDLSNIHGKVLRINKDGTIPSDNPFASSGNIKKEIYSYGLRNPFRFNFLQDGRVIVGDVGEGSWEEINVLVKGGNFGHPHQEGICSNCPYINPIYAYPHNNQSASVTGGTVYTGSAFPSEYKGNYFFADYSLGFIKRLILDSGGNLIEEKSFDDTAGTVVELLQGGDGNLYFLTIFPGELYKVRFTSDNIAPTAKISANKTSGALPLSINFSSNGSSDPENKPLNYKWNFGDGTTSTEANPTKVYSNSGKFSAKLIVNDGSKDSEPVTLEIHAGNNAPQINFISPASDLKYNAGQSISYSATASDPEDGSLATSAFSWEVIFHHGTHIHPFLGPINGIKSGNFVIPDTGEPASNTWYEVKLTVTDSVGLKTIVSRNILPNKIKITLASDPLGMNLTVDGIPSVAPVTFEGVVGFKRNLDATSPQSKDGIGYDFLNWSDGGAKSHQIVTPQNDITYTAKFASKGSGTGNLRFRVREYKEQVWTGKYLNNIEVRLTDTTGLTVFQTKTSSNINGQDGWVYFDKLTTGTYGIMAYKEGYEGLWKQGDCATRSGTFTNATISNSNTKGLLAAWDNIAPVNTGQTTVCQDLGVNEATKGNLYFRILNIKGSDGNYLAEGFLNDVTVKLTDTTGQNVKGIFKSQTAPNGEEGWVFMKDVQAGTYGIMAYKSGYQGVVKMVNCIVQQNTSSIQNSNTEGLIAAWNNNAQIAAGKTIVCHDLGLRT